MLRALTETKEIQKFRETLNKIKPSVVHFASFDIDKPAKFITAAKEFGAKIVLQPWTMGFWCAQGFAFTKQQQCFQCARGQFTRALSNKCITSSGLMRQFERIKLRRSALASDIFLSSNVDLDSVLESYGVNRTRIKRFPVPFDCTTIPIKAEEEDYFIFYGQPNEHKGFNVLINTFSKIPHIKLKAFPLSRFNSTEAPPQNVEITNHIGWSNGLAGLLARSRGVVIPSLWATTTEYALYEAQLYQKAIVAFNVGAHKNLLSNRVNALVVAPGDLVAFADAIEELNNNKELRTRLGRQSFIDLIDTNDMESLSKLLHDIYLKEPS